MSSNDKDLDNRNTRNPPAWRRNRLTSLEHIEAIATSPDLKRLSEEESEIKIA